MTKKRTAADCECQTDVEIPGDHIPECPWSDPEYLPPEFHDDVARGAAEWRDGITRKLGLKP